MMDLKGTSVLSYLAELLAGLVIILGVLLLVGAVLRVDLVGGLIGAVLIAAGTFVFKRPGRSRRAR